MERVMGIEPSTPWLKVKCSTDWANGSQLAGVAGLEPTNDRVKVCCLTAWLYPISTRPAKKKMVSPQGFEPRTHGLEGRCSIQLSYEPVYWSGWWESNSRYQLGRLKFYHWTTSAKVERKTRFELATLALARRCSTPEPLPHIPGRGGWIRTIESSANGFTVRPLWPLGNPST